MKSYVLLLVGVMFNLQACTQNRNANFDENSGNVNITENGTMLTQQQKQTMLQDYAGWLNVFNNTYPSFMQSTAQVIQMGQQTLQQGAQINQQMQQMGMAVPRNYQQEQQMQNMIQQEQYKYQLLNYQYEFVKMQNQILQQLFSNPNDQLFNQATAYHAFLMYQNFAYEQKKEQQFEIALNKALRWYFSPQSKQDIQANLEMMKAQNHALRNQRTPNITSGSAYLNNDDRHVEKFCDNILDRKTWIDTSNGDRYKMDISIENPTINGQDMKEY